MSILEWAQNEVDLACKEILNDPQYINDLTDAEYSVNCCRAALKAFETLCGDGHSGQSIQFTKAIFDRLVDGRCLTPVEDQEDQWQFAYDNSYQHVRMSSLFKTVNPDGSVKYSDTNRTVTYDLDQEVGFHMGLASKIVDEMFPITLPYYPMSTPYKVCRESCLVDPMKGDYDTVAILYVITPKGDKVKIDKYFTEDFDGNMEEIDLVTYLKLRKKRVDK